MFPVLIVFVIFSMVIHFVHLDLCSCNLNLLEDLLRRIFDDNAGIIFSFLHVCTH